jgi:hypothetical protein
MHNHPKWKRRVCTELLDSFDVKRINIHAKDCNAFMPYILRWMGSRRKFRPPFSIISVGCLNLEFGKYKCSLDMTLYVVWLYL